MLILPFFPNLSLNLVERNCFPPKQNIVTFLSKPTWQHILLHSNRLDMYCFIDICIHIYVYWIYSIYKFCAFIKTKYLFLQQPSSGEETYPPSQISCSCLLWNVPTGWLFRNRLHHRRWRGLMLLLMMMMMMTWSLVVCSIIFEVTPTWGNDPIWPIFCKWVETTN